MNSGNRETGAFAAANRMWHAVDAAALQLTGLFAGLPDTLLKEAASRAILRHLQHGEVLFSEHDEASGLYIVAHGELRSMRHDSSGREQVLSTERAGAVLAAPVFN